MSRIYFDSNVFSNLRKREQPKYMALKEAIEKYKNNLIFVFSHAHIRDKINDTSNFKFEDFAYMKDLVDDNYLSYHAIEKNTCFYLANPHEVFQENDALANLNFVMEMMGPYKELRTLIEGGTEIISIGGKVYNRKELFNDGKLGESFVDFVKTSLYHEDKSKIPYYDFYLHSYALLDMLDLARTN
jgi:hypothetical protein